jgi:hypothetical protein
MKIDEIEIHVGKPPSAFKVLGSIRIRVGAATIFSKAPTIDEANQALREVAVSAGANAIIDVQYNRGVSFFSWKALTATGTAVLLSASRPPELVAGQLAAETPEARLKCLRDLQDKGLITDAEFEAKKREILSAM